MPPWASEVGMTQWSSTITPYRTAFRLTLRGIRISAHLNDRPMAEPCPLCIYLGPRFEPTISLGNHSIMSFGPRDRSPLVSFTGGDHGLRIPGTGGVGAASQVYTGGSHHAASPGEDSGVLLHLIILWLIYPASRRVGNHSDGTTILTSDFGSVFLLPAAGAVLPL